MMGPIKISEEKSCCKSRIILKLLGIKPISYFKSQFPPQVWNQPICWDCFVNLESGNIRNHRRSFGNFREDWVSKVWKGVDGFKLDWIEIWNFYQKHASCMRKSSRILSFPETMCLWINIANVKQPAIHSIVMSLGDWKVSGGWGKNGQWESKSSWNTSKANNHRKPKKTNTLSWNTSKSKNHKKTKNANYHERPTK